MTADQLRNELGLGPSSDPMAWVPERYRDAQIDTMDNRTVADRLAAWDWRRNPLLYGGFGTGKSWGMAGLSRQLIERGEVKRPMWMNTSRYFNQLRASFSGDEAPLPPRGYDLVCVDDLGKERSTPWVRELMYVMFGEWYDLGTKFIITTNLSLDEIEAHVGGVVFDRLCEMCESVRYEGPSRRRMR